MTRWAKEKEDADAGVIKSNMECEKSFCDSKFKHY